MMRVIYGILIAACLATVFFNMMHVLVTGEGTMRGLIITLASGILAIVFATLIGRR